MGWETRGSSGRYYTRSRRCEGRVVREYVGGGLAGECAATADIGLRVARRVARDARSEELKQIAELDAKVIALSEAVETAAKAALLIAGFHRHARGEWRRRRD
jgi:hypothetical protein